MINSVPKSINEIGDLILILFFMCVVLAELRL